MISSTFEVRVWRAIDYEGMRYERMTSLRVVAPSREVAILLAGKALEPDDSTPVFRVVVRKAKGDPT